MSHLVERTLDRLVGGTATPSDVERILRHVEECRACARKLEEWRDNFPEVDERFPELALDMPALATVTPGGLVLMPEDEEPRRRFEIDLSTILWIGAVLMALLVGYGASRLRQSSEGMVAAVDPVPRDATTSATATVPRVTPTAPAPAATTPPDPRAATTPAPSQDRPVAAATPTPSPPVVTPSADPAPAPLSTSPRFRKVSRAEAVRRLGGPVRSLQGFDADHLEIGAASAVPGAQAGLDIIRVVYRAADGSRILLDQQLLPTDSSGFRSIDDPTLESGETLYGTSPTGVSVATWLDEDGYRISLVAQVSLDSLKRMVPQVR